MDKQETVELRNFENLQDSTRKDRSWFPVIFSLTMMFILIMAYNEYAISLENLEIVFDLFGFFILLLAFYLILTIIISLIIDKFYDFEKLKFEIRQQITKIKFVIEEYYFTLKLIYFLICLAAIILLIEITGSRRLGMNNANIAHVLIYVAPSIINELTGISEFLYLRGYRELIGLKSQLENVDSIDLLLKNNWSRRLTKSLGRILVSNKSIKYSIVNNHRFIENLNEVVLFKDQENIQKLKFSINNLIIAVEGQDFKKITEATDELLQINSSISNNDISGNGDNRPSINRYSSKIMELLRNRQEIPEYIEIIKIVSKFFQVTVIPILSILLAAIVLIIIS